MQDTESKDLRPLKGKILVSDLEAGLAKIGNILLPDDNMTETGVRDRWAKVHSVGEGIVGVKVGDWVLLKHGRWGWKFKDPSTGEKIWLADYPKGILIVSDERPDHREAIAAPSLNSYLG